MYQNNPRFGIEATKEVKGRRVASKRKVSFGSVQPRKKPAGNKSNKQNGDNNEAVDQAVPSEDEDEDVFTFDYSDDDMPTKREPKREGSDDGEEMDIKEEESEDAHQFSHEEDE
ncbi:uncharacterized protein BKA55DRAFT_722112 [Fusarium redolens]|uniref:Uncharacterized protein n=1 Tax=Fusarium redolens TaxID=48865 RepID=A0A9P9KNL1_FUSRE|nr:uncharacterized protein BKA55DRAFT_722112 [Fusarium redolens]KAH7260939.1 hypothetical protein BKA55DRAFT_722112 [Fusarium redolens]